MEQAAANLDRPLKLELYTSHNFMGFFVAEEDANYLNRLALQYVKEVSNSSEWPNSCHILDNKSSTASFSALRQCITVITHFNNFSLCQPNFFFGQMLSITDHGSYQ